MRAAQIHRLQESFALIESRADVVADTFYRHLFALAPALRASFADVDMATQGGMVLQAVGIAVSGLEDVAALRPTLASLGYRHIGYGVEPEDYEYAVEALLKTFREVLGNTLDEELEALWRRALAQVTATMVEGGEALRAHMEARARSRFRDPMPDPVEDAYLARFLPPSTEGEEVYAEPGAQDTERRYAVEFVGDKTCPGAPLQSLLDIALAAGIPHASACGGRGKCTTCRVVVLDGLDHCLPRNQPEARMAQVKGFPPELRLACQTRLSGPVKVRRLVKDAADVDDVLHSGQRSTGRELRLAVLFSDIREFTRFSEGNLPYDIVHALNRYFNAVGETLDEHNGYIDKYMGDGIMALFGLNPRTAKSACADAVDAAVAMIERMGGVNEYLAAHLGHEFRIGIGIDYGTVVVGEIGFKLRRQFTAIGDAVNVASRLESETKDRGADILISEDVRRELPDGRYRLGEAIEVALKGKARHQIAYAVEGRVTP